MKPLSRALFALTVAWGLACGVGYKENMTAERLAETDRPHTRIARYLAQRSADPAVCDTRRTDGFALPFVDRRLIDAVHHGLDEGTIPPGRWKACVTGLWRSADPVRAVDLTNALVRSLKRACRPRPVYGLEIARLEGLRDLVVERPLGHPIEPDALDALVSRARESARRLGADTRQGIALLEIAEGLEVERGTLDGAPITEATIEQTDVEYRLVSWAERLPREALRAAAARKLVRLRIERSPLSWVRSNGPTLERQALEGPVPLPPELPIRRARFAPRSDGTTHLRVLQQSKRIRLLPATADNSRSADPSLDLAGALLVDVVGFERPITVCGRDRYDPTPCVPPERLAMVHPVATLAETGRVLFPTQLDMAELLKLGSDGDRLAAQVSAGGVVAPIDLPLVYDTVDPLVYGTAIRVDAYELSADRILFEIRYAGRDKVVQKVVVPMSDRFFSISLVGKDAPEPGASMSGGGGRGSATVRFGQDNATRQTIRVRMHCTRCREVRTYLEEHVRSTGRVVIKRVDAKPRKGKKRRPKPTPRPAPPDRRFPRP